MPQRFTVAALLCALTFPQARADPIFFDDFQDGDLAGWNTSGTTYANFYFGNYALGLHYGNYSLGMRGVDSSADYHLSTDGYANVNISLDISAHSLEFGDSCIAEVSNDGGRTWVNAITLFDGQDDGALYTAAGIAIDADNKNALVIRYRTSVNQYYDYCYGDNILVTGDVDNSGGSNEDYYGELTGNGDVPRTLLRYNTLMSGGDPGSLIDLSGYALPANAAHPRHAFAGKLTLHGEATGGSFVEHEDTFDDTGTADDTRKHLPELDFRFLQTGSHIFPLKRGSVASSHPNWEYVLTPGRVWQENGDDGYSRASIPFALQQRNANCVHNGVMSFLFKEDGSVSKVAYQISSETCLYFKADWWGLLNATYTPQSFSARSRLIQDYQEEIAARLPVKPLAALNSDYPGIDYAAFASPNGTDAGHISTVGFVIDGIHYRGACVTRRGDYPFCDSLVVPSYSTAKSLFAGVAMMRLEQQYPGVSSSIVGNYVGSCHNNGNWSDVTLNDLLDMATGNYGSSAYMVDEGAAHTDNLFLVDSHSDKINYSCTQYPRKATPGSRWVYHTSDTYIAGTVMNAYLKSRQGADADIFVDTIVKDLWKPIGVGPTGQYTRRTYDSVAQPFAGWGLIWLPDDVAKIASFVAIDDGMIHGRQMLNAAQLDAALQRSASDAGTVPLADHRYNNGFWARNVAGKLIGCSGDQWIPFLSGYSGITVVLLPNDSVYYHFGDNNTYYWLQALQEAHKIRSVCE